MGRPARVPQLVPARGVGQLPPAQGRGQSVWHGALLPHGRYHPQHRTHCLALHTVRCPSGDVADVTEGIHLLQLEALMSLSVLATRVLQTS